MAHSTLRIGNVEITALIDAEAKAPVSMIFPALTAADWEPYREHLVDDGKSLQVTIPTFIVRSGGKTVLIDSGIGGKQRDFFPTGRLPEELAAIGVKPEDIDLVFATHIHIDHVGWHTVAQGEAFVPTFPKATYVFNRPEFEFFTSAEEVEKPDRAYVRDSVVPLTGAAEIALVDGEHALTDELTLLPTPGHTPAHVSVAIASAGEAGVIIGDVCHHPAQMTETGWAPIFDTNPTLAAESRERLMQKIEDERMTAIAGHFAHPGFGRLVRVAGKRTWRVL